MQLLRSLLVAAAARSATRAAGPTACLYAAELPAASIIERFWVQVANAYAEGQSSSMVLCSSPHEDRSLLLEYMRSCAE